jgi:hypothetical protein
LLRTACLTEAFSFCSKSRADTSCGSRSLFSDASSLRTASILSRRFSLLFCALIRLRNTASLAAGGVPRLRTDRRLDPTPLLATGSGGTYLDSDGTEPGSDRTGPDIGGTDLDTGGAALGTGGIHIGIDGAEPDVGGTDPDANPDMDGAMATAVLGFGRSGAGDREGDDDSAAGDD